MLPAAPVINTTPASSGQASVPPWDDLPTEPAATPARRINPGKVRQVARILGLAGGEEDGLIRLIDEFLAMNEAGSRAAD